MRKHKQWIQGAKIKKGALKARAKAAGVSLSKYESMKHTNPTIKREVALAKTFKRMAKRR